jgi:voltage-gated potassium channel
MPFAKRLDDTLVDEIIIVVLSLLSVALLIFEVVADASSAQMRFLEQIDVGIAFVFLGEWVLNLLRAEDRRRYLRRRWWELLACVPISSDLAHVLRGVRLLRVIRLVRLLRIARLAVRVEILARESKAFFIDSSLIYISTASAVIVFSAALAFHYFEMSVNPNVHNFFDSFWWAIATVTTVGYGDIYPVTTEGRIVAIFLMLTGIGTLGVYTAAIANYVIRQNREPGQR